MGLPRLSPMGRWGRPGYPHHLADPALGSGAGLCPVRLRPTPQPMAVHHWHGCVCKAVQGRWKGRTGQRRGTDRPAPNKTHAVGGVWHKADPSPPVRDRALGDARQSAPHPRRPGPSRPPAEPPVPTVCMHVRARPHSPPFVRALPLHLPAKAGASTACVCTAATGQCNRRNGETAV